MSQPIEPQINVAEELKKTPKQHVLDQNDPAIQSKVAEFIREAKIDQLSATAEKPAIPPSTDFNESPLNLETMPGMPDISKVEVDMYEKSAFLKSLLADDPADPIRLSINLMDGQMKLLLRARTAFEQKRMYNIADLNRLRGMFRIKNPNGPEFMDDPAAVLMRFHQYGMALMLVEINGKPFSDIAFKEPTHDSMDRLEVDAKIIDDFVDKNIAGMSMVRWTVLVGAMRTFEAKLARMSTEANNGDFWKPRA